MAVGIITIYIDAMAAGLASPSIPFIFFVQHILDSSAISTGIVAGMQADKNFKVTTPPEAEARDAVRRGSLAAAVIIPKGFGDAAGNAFFGDGASRRST